MKTRRKNSSTRYVFFIAAGISLSLLMSCEEWNDPGNNPPCDDYKCNEPYEVLSTVDGICNCVCAPGFTGPDCKDFEHGNCDVVFCVNGGTKRIHEDYCYCECPPGFGGEICEIPLTACGGVQCPEGQSPDPEDDCACK